MSAAIAAKMVSVCKANGAPHLIAAIITTFQHAGISTPIQDQQAPIGQLMVIGGHAIMLLDTVLTADSFAIQAFPLAKAPFEFMCTAKGVVIA